MDIRETMRKAFEDLANEPYKPQQIVCHPAELGFWLTVHNPDDKKYKTTKHYRDNGTVFYDTHEVVQR